MDSRVVLRLLDALWFIPKLLGAQSKRWQSESRRKADEWIPPHCPGRRRRARSSAAQSRRRFEIRGWFVPSREGSEPNGTLPVSTSMKSGDNNSTQQPPSELQATKPLPRTSSSPPQAFDCTPLFFPFLFFPFVLTGAFSPSSISSPASPSSSFPTTSSGCPNLGHP